MRVERYKANRWHRSRAEEVATTLLGVVLLVVLSALALWLIPVSR